MKSLFPAAIVALCVMLAGCTTPNKSATPAAGVTPPRSASTTSAASPQSPTPAPVAPKPFEEAVKSAATALFLALPAEMASRVLVIDPLIDGVTGEQNAATRSVEAIALKVMQSGKPALMHEQLSAQSLAKKPLLLIGTFTGLNAQGQTSGERVAYRICLALADTATDKIVAKGTGRALPAGIDLTPLAYYRDAPAWAVDQVTEGYIRSCQSVKPGDSLDAFYKARLISAASVFHAVEAYNAKRYKNALEFYAIAMRAGAGDELRIMNGVFLSNWKLKRTQAARLVMQKIIDFGFERQRMAVKFLFEPGSITFLKDPDFLATNPLWMKELATRAEKAKVCMEIQGHVSRGTPDAASVNLSQDRAQFVRHLLIQQKPELERRTVAIGRGADDNLVGNGKNDASDILDRRAVFRMIDCNAAST